MVQSRKSRGSVNINNNSGGIRLRWNYGGKPYFLTLPGLRFDNADHQRLAHAKAKEVESDLIYERFDPTLAKYDPRRKVIAPVQVTSETSPYPAIPLSNLWEQYAQYRKPIVTQTTEETHYKRISGHIAILIDLWGGHPARTG